MAIFHGQNSPIVRHYLLLLLLTPCCLLAQDLTVFEAFTDHAVLQRDTDHPIWGWAKPGRQVSVEIAGKTVKAKTDKTGKWKAQLPEMPAGGPHLISLADGRSMIELSDIYFGDVYLLSGQSNMEWRLAQSDPDSTRARAIADPLIRQVLVAKSSADEPLDHLSLDESWKAGTTNEIADFSGVGAYFSHYLREGGVDVPIGLLHSSWGGSRLEPWLSAEVLDDQGLQARDESTSVAKAVETKVGTFFSSEFPGEAPPMADEGEALGYLQDATDLTNWATMELPGMWESKGYTNIDGIFYFRRDFDLTAEQATQDARLYLGAIDDGDWTYINGQQVGSNPNAYSLERMYEVPASFLREGRNTLAIRVYDGAGGGGFTSSPEQLYLKTGEDRVPLAGQYHYRIGEFKTGGGQPNQVPTLLYNAMIAPLQDWPLTGVLWYQGESNAGPGDAEAYAEQMRTLVNFWRDRFDNDRLPFYWVQLANFQDAPTQPDQPGWATLRASQTAALDLPMTGQAVIIDIGEAGDIHPKNKWEVGRRLSLHALKDIYGRNVQAASPIAKDFDVEGYGAVVQFAEKGLGLTVHQEEGNRYPIVKSLTVRDEAGEWRWAIGFLQPNEQQLLVVNPAGTKITGVRYAWFSNPDDANLYSIDGLPVTPFELLVD